MSRTTTVLVIEKERMEEHKKRLRQTLAEHLNGHPISPKLKRELEELLDGHQDTVNLSYEEMDELLGHPIAFHRVFATIAGSVGGGVFLSQLHYWRKHTTDPEKWVYKTAAEWFEETMLGRRELDTVRRALKGKGIIREKLKGMPATLHYKIEWDAFVAALKTAAQEQVKKAKEKREKSSLAESAKLKSSLAESAKLDWRKAPNQFGGKRQITYRTETTSETTTENTTTTKSGSHSPVINGNGAAHPVVVVSPLASDGDSDQDIADKLIAEFGEFSSVDAVRIAEQVAQSRGYVLDAAEGARVYAGSHRVKNRAGLFMKALGEGWKPPKASEPVKQRKAKPAIEVVEEEPMSFDQRCAALAVLKNGVRSTLSG